PDRVVHQPARHVDFADGAARPGNHFGRQHRAHAELLAASDQYCVHAGGVRCGEFGQIADPHQHFRLRVPAAHFGVALERCHETVTDRLENRIDEITDAPPRKLLEAWLECLERAAELGNDDDTPGAAGEL